MARGSVPVQKRNKKELHSIKDSPLSSHSHIIEHNMYDKPAEQMEMYTDN